MAHKVFICHSSTDKAVADAACAALEAQRIPCWIAPRDILAGEEYGESIVEAIAACQIMLLVFSAQANNSPQVRREIERGVSKGKIIVPFRIEDILPSRAMEFALSNTHWLDALTPPMESYLLQLCDTISRLIQKHSVAATPLWTPPDVVSEPISLPEIATPVLQSEPISGQARVTGEPTAVKSSKNQEPSQQRFWRKVPIWGWVLVPISLAVVFALGRLLAPSSTLQPSPHASPQPVSNAKSNAAAAPAEAPQKANPAPSERSGPPVQKQNPATTISSATAPSAAATRPTGVRLPEPSPTAVMQKPTIDAVVQQANALIDQQRYGDAVPLLGQACSGGNAIACDRLGRLNQAGKGVAQNQTQAAALYSKACDGQFGEGCRDLAVMYASGMGVAQDYSHAATLLSKACDEGVIGCNNLGLLYAGGRGVAQSYLHAAALYTKACSGGIATGCSNLALLYANGQGVAQSYADAATFFSKACDEGDAGSCSTLGLFYLQGLAVTKDPNKARQLLTKGCSLGSRPGCDKLKQMQ